MESGDGESVIVFEGDSRIESGDSELILIFKGE
jgi:hypothetical protein